MVSEALQCHVCYISWCGKDKGPEADNQAGLGSHSSSASQVTLDYDLIPLISIRWGRPS